MSVSAWIESRAQRGNLRPSRISDASGIRDVFFRHRQELELAQHDGGDIASPHNQAGQDRLWVVLGRTLQYMLDHIERGGPHLEMPLL
jgi:hypothetical protein